MKWIVITLMLFPVVIWASSTTWEGTGSNQDMTNGTNWSSGVPTSTTIADFDSTITDINLTPSIDSSSINLADFSALSFNFLNSASDFTFSITEPYALTFTGAGITGTNTNTTINSNYNTGTPTTLYQVSFSNTDGISTSPGDAALSVINSVTISNSSSANDLAQFLFDGSGGLVGGTSSSTVMIGGSASLTATNESGGTLSNLGILNDAAQILFDGSRGAKSSGTGSSKVTISDSALLCAVNNGVISEAVNGNANDIAQILFDGSGGLGYPLGMSVGMSSSKVTITGNAILTATNSNTLSTIYPLNDLAQILFDGSGGVGYFSGTGNSQVTISGNALLNASNANGAVIVTQSSTTNTAQILFDGSGGLSVNNPVIGNSVVTIDGNASLNATNASNASILMNYLANDLGQIIFCGSSGNSSFAPASSVGSSTVTIGGRASLTATNSISGTLSNAAGFFSNDLAQIMFDGSGGFAGGQGSSTVTIGGSAIVSAINEGTLSNLITANDLAQILFDGSGGLSNAGLGRGSSVATIGGDASLVATNSGTISNTGTIHAVAQILFDGSTSSGATGECTVAFGVNNNVFASNIGSGTVDGDQIAFYDTAITGSPILKASNQGSSVTGHGVAFYGAATTATTPNIVLENSSLWIDSTVTSPFSIASLAGDDTSTVPLNQSLTIFTQTGASTTFNGVISDFSGTNNLVITGTGRQVLAGNNTFGGTAIVNGGNLALTGSVAHDVIVNNGGIFSGTGTVFGNVTVNSGGTIYPGMSLGTLHLNQNYTQNTGGIYAVQVSGALAPDGTPKSSLLSIVDTANLAGTLDVVSTDGTYSIGRPYTILTSGTLVGTFNQVVVDSPFLNVRTIYNTDPSVQIILSTDFVAGAHTSNQENVANQIDSIAVPVGFEEVVINNLLSLTPEQLSRALDEMAGEQYAYLVQTDQDSDRRFGRRIFNAVRNTLDPYTCMCETDCECVNRCMDIKTWSSYEGGYGALSDGNQARGYHEYNVDFSMGADTQFNCFRLGAAINGEITHLTFNLSGHNTHYNVQGGIYGVYVTPQFYVFSDLIVGEGFSKFKRQISFADIDLKAHSNPRFTHGLLYAEWGWNVCMCDALIQPFLGIDCGYTYASEFKESRAKSLDLHVDGRSVWNPNLYIGAHFASMAWCVEFNADIAYQHRFGSLGTTLHSRFIDFGETFTVKGQQYSRDGFVGSLDAVVNIAGFVDAYAEFSGELWGKRYSYAGTVGIRRAW